MNRRSVKLTAATHISTLDSTNVKSQVSFLYESVPYLVAVILQQTAMWCGFALSICCLFVAAKLFIRVIYNYFMLDLRSRFVEICAWLPNAVDSRTEIDTNFIDCWTMRFFSWPETLDLSCVPGNNLSTLLPKDDRRKAKFARVSARSQLNRENIQE